MAKYERTLVSTAYKVELDLCEFMYVCAYEWEAPTSDFSTLAEVLEEDEHNCIDVDYNGHFGAALFFSLEPDYDNAVAWHNIIVTIEEYVVTAKEYCIKNNISID